MNRETLGNLEWWKEASIHHMEAGTNMQATMYRINFEKPDGVSLEELFASLCKGPNNLDGAKHLLYMKEETSHYAGLVVQIRDQKAFLTVEGITGADPILTREQLGNKQMLEFNLFVLGKKTWSALYLHYPRSCSWNRFGILCKQRCSAMQKSRQEAATASIPAGLRKKEQEHQLREIRKKFRTPLKWNIQLTEEDFLALVQKATRVHDFAYTSSTEILEKRDYAPASTSVRSRRANVSITFYEGQTLGAQGYIAGVVDALRGKIRRARSRVVLNNEEHIIHLMKNPSSHGRMEFDSIAEEMADLRLSKFHTIGTIGTLIARARQLRILA
ncbi:MAG: hypothetical protein NTW86_08035 [Candidatus Sumerlaeota bacterium]|nr:hypothetical protein [Candidatus Sumerlaeota bacterium]